jgi:hypothetical protein
MAKNSLIGLVTGLFSNNTEATTARAYREIEPANVANLGLVTGVARYLESHKGTSTVSTVSKYLKKQEQIRISGVAKYLIRQSVAERQNKSSEVSTGVSKYLKTKKDVAPVVKTGVTKYLDGLEKTQVSRVTKYVVKKSIAEKNKPAPVRTTKVASYLENKKEHTASGVAKYLTRQMIAEKRAIAEAVVYVKPLTSVDKYLLGHA